MNFYFITHSNVNQMQSNKHSTSSSGNKRSSTNDDNQNSDSFAIQTNNIQLLLCGDLNSLPNSGVVQYLLDGKISTHHKDFKNLSYKNTLTKMLSHSPNQEFYTHAFKVIWQAKKHDTDQCKLFHIMKCD